MIEPTEDDWEVAYEFTRTGWMSGSDGIAILAEMVRAHRQQAEDAIIRAADKWLAAQYGLRPLVADIDRIRGMDAGGEG